MRSILTNSSPKPNSVIDRELLIEWLLENDVAIQYQVHRDLLAEERPDLQNRIATEGWGAHYLEQQKEDGHWGKSFYNPKWTSSHYTLLDLRTLCLPPDQQPVKAIISRILKEERSFDGGISPSPFKHPSDVCINGMFLNYACYFETDEKDLHAVVDYILDQRMPDGGYNCRLSRSGARHSSLHSTLSVAEGIREYDRNGYTYRIDELLESENNCISFMLQHRLFLSDRTGEIIQPGFLKLAFPGRWRYDILRALDYLRLKGDGMDERIIPALEQLIKKRRKNGTWTSSRHQGQTHFDMEKTGPSRWNTLRALRVLEFFKLAND